MLELEGRLAFCCLTPTIQKTFHIMGLTQYAKVFPDEAAAVAEMTGGAASRRSMTPPPASTAPALDAERQRRLLALARKEGAERTFLREVLDLWRETLAIEAWRPTCRRRLLGVLRRRRCRGSSRPCWRAARLRRCRRSSWPAACCSQPRRSAAPSPPSRCRLLLALALRLCRFRYSLKQPRLRRQVPRRRAGGDLRRRPRHRLDPGARRR